MPDLQQYQHNHQQLDSLTASQVNHTTRSVSAPTGQNLQTNRIDKARLPPCAGDQLSDSGDEKLIVCNLDNRRVRNGSQDSVTVQKTYGHSYSSGTPVKAEESAIAQVTTPGRNISSATPTKNGNYDKDPVVQIRASSPEQQSVGADGRGRWSRSMRRGPLGEGSNTVSAE